ncbi:MAG: hypothetical protein JXR91_06255 [Deltaproteobacteria bacterium]|nr:hypothetical protein [Deltaproteobacteria bacterium]
MVKSKPDKDEPGFGALKIIAAVFIALIIGVSILGKVSGLDKKNRGTLVQDEVCTTSQKCSLGYRCYDFQNTSLKCHKKCSENNDCPAGYDCKTAVQASRKKIKTARMCVSHVDL